MSREEGRRVKKMTNPNNNENDGVVKSDLQDRGFYNVHDGLKGRDGGPYLDHVIRQQSELNRALVEQRDPADLNGPLPADAGTPLVVAALVIDNSLTSNPSMALRPGFAAVLDDASFKDKRNGTPQGEADTVSIADPISTLPVDVATDTGNETATDDKPADTAPAPAKATPAPTKPVATYNS